MPVVIVDCAIYHEGRREDVPGGLGDAFTRARADPDAFIWIGLHEPSTSEFDLVAKEFDLHPLAVEDAVHAHQRPKLERYGDSLFAVLKTLRYVESTSDIETGEIMLFLGEGFVLTVRHGGGSPLGAIRARLEGDKKMLALGPSAVLYAICDEVVDTYEAIAREVEADIAEVEQRVFSPERTNDAESIYALKREVIEFRRAVLPLVEPMRLLTNAGLPEIHPETRPFFRDVSDHVLRVSGDVAAFDDLLTSVLNANLAQVSVRQNEDMRRISAWVAIVAVPTMVAGIYGMNFDHMPELRWRFGYPLVILVMVVACTALYRLFRRSGWL
ncbi:MAG: magnesium/cobalt transporter CorA [Streptosporangiales bacterium]|nr:magnesium/cobalt transporter CorA [Streptosporangiales bacterium]